MSVHHVLINKQYLWVRYSFGNISFDNRDHLIRTMQYAEDGDEVVEWLDVLGRVLRSHRSRWTASHTCCQHLHTAFLSVDHRREPVSPNTQGRGLWCLPHHLRRHTACSRVSTWYLRFPTVTQLKMADVGYGDVTRWQSATCDMV